MGMYTELIFGAAFRKDTPPEVINTLLCLAGDSKADETQPMAFETSSGRNPLRGGSYYFAICDPVTKMWFDDIRGKWALSSRGNIKNYEDEIEQFLKWVKPYLEQGSGTRETYAIVQYDDSDLPELYHLHDE